jgi:energy-converting hydrogenase Eha subunit A
MTDATAPIAAPRQRSRLWFAWRRFLSNKAAVIGGVVLGILILMAIFAPLITPYNPEAQSFLTEALAFPSAEHWFGVDNLGRDFYSRVVYGSRVSLTIGFTAALFSVLIGIPLGALAGYFGGRTDWVIMRIIEVFSVIPPLPARACPDKGFSRKGVRARRAGSRRFALVHHPPSPHPQLDQPDHHRLRSGYPARHDARSQPQLPRRRRAPADADLGSDDQ